MSQQMMQKNERKTRQSAFMITTIFYLALAGGIVAYTGGTDFSQYLPSPVQEWWSGEQEIDDRDRV